MSNPTQSTPAATPVLDAERLDQIRRAALDLAGGMFGLAGRPAELAAAEILERLAAAPDAEPDTDSRRELLATLPRGSGPGVKVWGIRADPDPCGAHPRHAPASHVEVTLASGVTIATDGSDALWVRPERNTGCADVLDWHSARIVMQQADLIETMGQIARWWLAADDLAIAGVRLERAA